MSPTDSDSKLENDDERKSNIHFKHIHILFKHKMFYLTNG